MNLDVRWSFQAVSLKMYDFGHMFFVDETQFLYAWCDKAKSYQTPYPIVYIVYKPKCIAAILHYESPLCLLVEVQALIHGCVWQ